MPRIRCHYLDCVFNDEGICSASAVEFDPDAGCLTFSQSTKLITAEWEDEDEEMDEDWEDLGYEDEDEDDDDDDWLDDDDLDDDDDDY